MLLPVYHGSSVPTRHLNPLSQLIKTPPCGGMHVHSLLSFVFMKCSVQAPSQLLCAQIAKLEGWLHEMLGLASVPFAFNCMENAVVPFVVSSDLYSKHLLLWSESFLGRKPKGLARAPIEKVYSSLPW